MSLHELPPLFVTYKSAPSQSKFLKDWILKWAISSILFPLVTPFVIVFQLLPPSVDLYSSS